MQHRKTLSSLAVSALLVAAIAAPVATAMPIDPRQRDMHASTVEKSAAPKQDLRTEAAAEKSRTPVNPQTNAPIAKQDLRTEAAADPSRAPELPAGLPTWPLNPKPIVPVSQEPVADGDGGGVDWQVPVFAAIGALLLAGGLAVAGTRYRATHAAS
jgi:hypothetical protein